MSIQFDFSISQNILNVVSRVDRLRGDWSAHPGVGQARLERMHDAAAIRSIGASCRLSGIHVSDHEVAGALRGDSVPLPDTRAILGYAGGLGFRFGGSPLLDATVLRRLNATVLGRPASEDEPLPELRQQQLYNETFDTQGRATGRVIPTLPPRLIPAHLEDLLTWFELEMREGRRHPLPVVGVFTLGLLAICPFEFGNGRTIRVLVGHLLERAGYAHARYSSLEVHMEDLREVYYDAFDRSQSGIWSGSADFSPWLDYFMEVLDRHRARLETKLALEREGLDLSELQQTILATVREHGTVDAGLLLKATGANRNTLKDNVRRLVSKGVLEKTGERRATRYRLASPDRARDASGAGPNS